MRVFGWGFLIVVAIVVGLAMIGSHAGVSTTTTASDEIPLTLEMKRDIGALIRADGYNCPEPKIAFSRGTDQYGTITELYCGPADGSDNSYENDNFRVTVRPNKTLLVSPWK